MFWQIPQPQSRPAQQQLFRRCPREGSNQHVVILVFVGLLPSQQALISPYGIVNIHTMLVTYCDATSRLLDRYRIEGLRGVNVQRLQDAVWTRGDDSRMARDISLYINISTSSDTNTANTHDDAESIEVCCTHGLSL
jgi:hypothetical protein